MDVWNNHVSWETLEKTELVSLAPPAASQCIRGELGTAPQGVGSAQSAQVVGIGEPSFLTVTVILGNI